MKRILRTKIRDNNLTAIYESATSRVAISKDNKYYLANKQGKFQNYSSYNNVFQFALATVHRTLRGQKLFGKSPF